jgi:four helix bundle protein
MDELLNIKENIISFKDLKVYNKSYSMMLIIMKDIVPVLPDIERNDLTDQLRRSCKAIPRLIAEGHAKRHQKAGFQKYLDDAIGEANEIIVSLLQAKDIYDIKPQLIDELVKDYNILAKQIFTLAKKWTEIKSR